MKRRTRYIALILFAIFSMSCSLLSGGQQTPTAVEDTAEAPVQEATVEVQAPAATEASVIEEVEEGAILTLEDAEKGVIRIVTKGAYAYAGWGSLEESFTGSGFIIDPSGLAITNNHVVTGAATIQVYFSDDPKPYNAKVLGVSECSDLAVIDIEGDGYPYFEWYTQDPKLGLEVYTLGYPLGDPNYTQHRGIVSKKQANVQTNWTDVEEVLEHDAQINPGNSGGPLVNDQGRVVGINYAFYDQANQFYAITYKEAGPILDKLMEGDNVLAIGVNGEAFITDDGYSGVWVYSVASGSPADKAGVRAGDVIEELEGITIANDGTMAEYCDVLRGHTADDVLSLKVWRTGTGEILEGQVNGRALEVTDDSGVNLAGDTGETETGQTETGGTTGEPFLDEFDGNLDDWLQWNVAGDPNKNFIQQLNGKLKWKVPSAETYAYVENQTHYYGDVFVEAHFNTVSGGRNGMALTCRSSDAGWYELRVSNRGMYAGSYEVYRYDPELKRQGRNPYVRLTRNERNYTKDIVNGFHSNTVGFLCTGNEFYVTINDVLQPNTGDKPITDNVLTEGYVGLGAMSFSDGSVEIEVDWFSSSAP